MAIGVALDYRLNAASRAMGEGNSVRGLLSSKIDDVAPRPKDACYKLILLVGPARSNKPVALFDLAARHDCPDSTYDCARN
jgi:hypothetical protein